MHDKQGVARISGPKEIFAVVDSIMANVIQHEIEVCMLKIVEKSELPERLSQEPNFFRADGNGLHARIVTPGRTFW
jgi:limonene-1,2-epoxide hydrolase